MLWNTIRLLDNANELLGLIAWLQALPQENEIHEITVWVRSGKHQTPMKRDLITRVCAHPGVIGGHIAFGQNTANSCDPAPYP
jgi:hypothetical protein